MFYFGENEADPLPDKSRGSLGTSKLGLFGTLNLPTGQPIPRQRGGQGQRPDRAARHVHRADLPGCGHGAELPRPSSVAEVESITEDTLFAGAVALAQPARGGAYRVNVDAILLAQFAAGKRPARCRVRPRLRGRGAVGLSLLHLGAAERVTMIEVDGALAKLAQRNARSNGWEARIDVVRADVADAESLAAGGGGRSRGVQPAVRGARPGPRPLPGPRARAQRARWTCSWMPRARVAGRRARVCFVYPAIEATTLLLELRKTRPGTEGASAPCMAPPRKGVDRARVVLVEAG